MSGSFMLTTTVGLAGGETIQFAEGHWPGEIGVGVALTQEGFELIEPHLRAAAPEWTDMHRYGVFDLKANARRVLVTRLHNEAAALPEGGGAAAQRELLTGLAAWLEARLSERQVISVLGV